MKKTFPYIVLLLIFIATDAKAQNDLEKQVPQEKTYSKNEVINPNGGISKYEGLNPFLRGDSTRTCAGYACEGWVIDYYDDGSKLHEGFYVKGQLKTYKNYFQSGKIEREFRNINGVKSEGKEYFENGHLKAEYRYYQEKLVYLAKFYSNGKIEHLEGYPKKGDYLIKKNSYKENGDATYIFELTNRNKMIYVIKEYYANGELKESGTLKYDEKKIDYYKEGNWTYYNESGKKIKEVQFHQNDAIKEKTF